MSSHQLTKEAVLATGEAFGKAILVGEHAVVYGVPALVAGLPKGARAHARDSETGRYIIGFGARWLPDEHEVHRALVAACQALQAPPCQVELELDIPAGSGLGASAALGVATVRAVANWLGQSSRVSLDAERLAEAAEAWEKVFHGNPSGVDQAAAQSGGVLRYVRGSAAQPLSLRAPLHLVVAIADPPASTKLMVQGVARLRQSNREQFDKNLEAIGTISENARICLERGDFASLGQLMNFNQMILAGWMLSTARIERACSIAREAGAFGAKLTGSGGGGCIVSVCPEDERARVRAELEKHGFIAFSSTIAASPKEHHHHD